MALPRRLLLLLVAALMVLTLTVVTAGPALAVPGKNNGNHYAYGDITHNDNGNHHGGGIGGGRFK